MNFAKFKLAVSQWSWKKNVDAVLPSLVSMAQQDLERQLRLRAMEYVTSMASVTTAIWMGGTVTSYDNVTGALVMNCLDSHNPLGATPGPTWNIESLASPIAAPAAIGTSSTVLAFGTGTKNITTQAGLSLTVGQYIYVMQGNSLAIPSGTSSIALPTDYIDMMYLTIIDGTNRMPIEQRFDIKSMQALAVDTTITGTPERISTVGDNILFDKKTDKAYGYELAYYRHLTELVTDAQSNWWTINASEALLYGTLKKLAIFSKSAEEIPFFDGLLKEQMATLKAEDDAQRVSGVNNAVGSVRVR